MPKYSRRLEVPGRTSQELFQKTQQEIPKLLEKLAQGKYDLTSNDKKKEFSVNASMFSATLVCQEGILELDYQVGLLVAPFRFKIDAAIDRWVAKAFNQQSSV